MTGAGAPVMLSAEGLEVRRHGRLALSVPRLEVRAGEILTVIGPNGAGKTTLVKALALLMTPDRGVVRVGGEAADKASALRLRRRMAAAFQEPLLLDMRVADNVALGLKLRGLPRSECDRRVQTWLERFGVAALARRSSRNLSGGEAQRVSLARAFAIEPEVLFLDEPFSSLDAPTREALAADLLEALRTTRTTTVMVTHDLDEALTFGDEVAVLIGGELRQVGPPAEVFSAPVDGDVARFVGVETIVPGVVASNEDGVATVKVGDVVAEVVSEFEPGAAVLLLLRPEEITLHPSPDGHPSSARNRLPGRVRRVTPWRGQFLVEADCGFPVMAAVTRRSVAQLELREGAPIVASFKATSAHLIRRK